MKLNSSMRLTSARRGRRHPARAHGGAVSASLRLHWPWRLQAPRRSPGTEQSAGTVLCPGSLHRSEVARPTHFAHCVRSVQTTAASQFTKRAARADLGPGLAGRAGPGGPAARQARTVLRTVRVRARLLVAPQIAPAGCRLPLRHRLFSSVECRNVTAKACPGRLRSACEAPSSAGLVARARSAPRQLTCRRLFERSERSERSELGDGPRDRAAQGSRSEAKTAEPKRSSLPGHAFAAPTYVEGWNH
jgi:hypothetical protein